MKQIAPEYLSPEAFEQFATDLVQKMFNRKMYSFSEGKDEGIDAIDNVTSPTLILQAKRYQVRTAAATIMKTVDTEIEKIKKTGERYHWNNFAYVFVTSSGLLPRHREILRSKYPSLFISDDYIIDKPQLDRLSRDKEYEGLFAQYGLIGKNLMAQVREFNLKSIEFESQFYFTEFRQKYFVETQAFDKAYNTISTDRIIILSGNPGVGKSTSSRMLGLLFSERLDNNYYVLERSINEIQLVINQYIAEFKESKTNLVVVFDDFLGRNTLDASDDQMRNVVRLYQLAEKRSNLYIILNSRTQILKEATVQNIEFRNFFELISERKEEIIIDISEISPNDRARIVRKNLEMIVDLTEDTDELKKLYEDIRVDKGYRKIVNNENFNPRLIEQISRNWRRVSDNDNFLTYILSVLNNPKDLYNELFERLSDAEKKFLLVLNSFEHFPMKLSFVENSFQSLDSSSVVDVKVIEERLESSWVIFRLNSSDTFIDFANPSIVDYFNKKVKGMLTIQSQILENSATLIQLYNSKTSLFKQEIVNNFYQYPDRNEFIGERIHYADLDKEEFSKLVKAFTIDKQPYFDSRLSKYGWSELIKDIQEFDVPLQQLFVDDIFHNELGFIDEDSANDDFESNLRAIQDVSKKVYGDQGKLQSHEKFYDTLQDVIFDNIQERIDESDFVYDLTEQMGGINSYDEGEDEDSFRKELQDNVSIYVQDMIDEFDFSDGIRDVDFDLEELGERVIENMSESDELADELGDRYQEHGNFDNGSDLVDDILDIPLD